MSWITCRSRHAGAGYKSAFVGCEKLEIRFIPQMPQAVWEKKAALNFILGGAGAGFYLSHALTSMLTQSDPVAGLILQPEWTAVLLVCAGLASVALEAGRPWRARFILSRLGSSWMSREALLAAVFILLCLLLWQRPDAALQVLCAACAGGFMASQGFVLHASRAVPAWNSSVLPLFLAVSSFYAGCGLNLINHSLSGAMQAAAPIAALIAGVADWGIGRIYCQSVGWVQAAEEDLSAFRKRRSKLREAVSIHLLPFGLIAVCALTAGLTGAPSLYAFLAAVAGAGILLSTSLRKYRIVTEMGYQREIGIHFRP